MKQITELFKRNGMYTYIPFVKQEEITIHENHHYYFTTNDEEVAKKIFRTQNNVIFVEDIEKCLISSNWAGLTLLNETLKTKEDLIREFNVASDADGIIIYAYEQIFKDSPIGIKEHCTFCLANGIKPAVVISENSRKYLVATKGDETIDIEQWKEYAAIFVGPTIDITLVSNNIKIKQKRRLGGTFPMSFHGGFSPEWQGDFFSEQIEITNELFDNFTVNHFKKSPIKMPNKEQATILLANGAFEEEITLANGNIMSFKGTEEITYDKRPKFDDFNAIVAERKVQKRNTVVIGLDYTNNCFVQYK